MMFFPASSPSWDQVPGVSRAQEIVFLLWLQVSGGTGIRRVNGLLSDLGIELF